MARPLQSLLRFSRDLSQRVGATYGSHTRVAASFPGQAKCFSATRATSHAESSNEAPPASTPKVVVFGGNGFVGSRVCQAVLKLGLDCTSVSRSGSTVSQGPWVKDVEWVKGDAFEPEAWKAQLQGACGVVSCIGAFGSNEFMEKICGDANVEIAKVAHEVGVKRFVFISAHLYGVEEDTPGLGKFGYVTGKRKAEAAVKHFFPSTGVILQPAFVHGTRQVSASSSIPLGLVGAPLEAVLRSDNVVGLAEKMSMLKPILAPPISVETLGAVAARAATDDSFPPGEMDCWTIPKYA